MATGSRMVRDGLRCRWEAVWHFGVGDLPFLISGVCARDSGGLELLQICVCAWSVQRLVLQYGVGSLERRKRCIQLVLDQTGVYLFRYVYILFFFAVFLYILCEELSLSHCEHSTVVYLWRYRPQSS